MAVSHDYNGAGRLTARDVSRGRTTYTWSPTTGRLTGISAPGGIHLTYTQDGSLPTRITWSGPVAGSVERTYDSTFRVVSEKVNGEAPVTYQYDADGLLTRAGDLTITRSPQTGLVTGTTLGVVTTANVYNTFGELIRQEAKSQGVPVLAIDYTRDRLGRITRKVETIEGVTATWDYVYDPAGRLQEVYRDGTRLSRYEYDANGNRLSHVTPTGTVTATYDAQDRLLTYGDLAYTYTANGELATKTQNGQTEQYEYDELGNLVKVTRPDGLVIEYLIDGQAFASDLGILGNLSRDWLRVAPGLTYNGLLRLRVGMPEAEVVKLIGEPLSKSPPDQWSPNWYWSYAKPGIMETGLALSVVMNSAFMVDAGAEIHDLGVYSCTLAACPTIREESALACLPQD